MTSETLSSANSAWKLVEGDPERYEGDTTVVHIHSPQDHADWSDEEFAQWFNPETGEPLWGFSISAIQEFEVDDSRPQAIKFIYQFLHYNPFALQDGVLVFTDEVLAM